MRRESERHHSPGPPATALCGLCLVLLLALVMPGAMAQDAAKDACGPGPNPVVALLPPTVVGSLPDALRPDELVFTEDFWRSWAWLEYQQANPCTDAVLVLRDARKGSERRLGAAGPARYEIRGKVAASVGQRRVPVVRLSGWNGAQRTTRQVELVTALGRIELNFELVDRKSGARYDRGRYLIDWVPPPPGDDAYEAPPGRLAIVDGKVYEAADNLFFGSARLDPAAQHLPVLAGGDPGRTIRRRRTPQVLRDARALLPGVAGISAAIRKILVLDGRGELLPDGVELALKASSGHMAGGESLGEGWWLARVQDGRIDLAALGYQPPGCAASARDRLIVRALPSGAAFTPDEHPGEAEIGLIDSSCLEAWALVRLRGARHRQDGEPAKVDGQIRRRALSLDETRDLSFFLELDPSPRREELDSGHEQRRYRVLAAQLWDVSLFITRRETEEEEDGAFVRWRRECTRRLRGAVSKPEASRDGSGSLLYVSFDSTSAAPYGLRLPRIASQLKWTGHAVCRERRYQPSTESFLVETFSGIAQAREEIGTWPDELVGPGLAEDPECYRASRDPETGLLQGRCEAVKDEEGWLLETSFEWFVQL